MKTLNLKSYSKGIRKAATAAALILPMSIGFVASAHADLCSPLRVSGMQIVNPTLVRSGATITGVTFRVKTTVKNTNATRTYYGNNQTQLVLRIPPVGPGSVEKFVTKFPRHIGGGAVQTVYSNGVTLKRDPGNLAEFKAKIEGYLFNSQCERGKQFSQSRHEFDLIGVLQNRPVRRISARVWGYSEESRPRPGTGAPRPRT